jgi:hypothetical protein
MAIAMGADGIEPDVVSTKDGVLIARHDPNLAYSTDVAAHPEYAARKRTLRVDGELQEGWFAGDFTLAEIKTLGGLSTDAERPQQFNGRYKIATIEEIIAMIKASGRGIALYPETKNPTFHRQQGLPLEDKLDAPVYIRRRRCRSAHGRADLCGAVRPPVRLGAGGRQAKQSVKLRVLKWPGSDLPPPARAAAFALATRNAARPPG